MKNLVLYTRKASDYLDKLSDGITTFRAVLYVLLVYLGGALLLSYNGKIPFRPEDIAISAVLLVIVSKLTDYIFSKTFKVPVNHESDIITGLILALIFTPANDARGYLILSATATIAMLSKFVLTYNAKHIFNPAAFGALVSAVVFNNYASWWVGTSFMTPLLIVGGFLIIRKMRRATMAAVFLVAILGYQFILQPLFLGEDILVSRHLVYLSLSATPLLFFASIMLTEPLTSPSKAGNGTLYALVVALLYGTSQLNISPEQALLIGNVLAFALEPSRSLLLRLATKQTEADGIISYLFTSSKKLNYKAGQYLEWTLPGVGIDARGNRRFLTLSSSPTEPGLMFTVKFPNEPSKFKQALSSLKDGQHIIATRLAGGFVLPSDTAKKLVFIAGGVGVTPFRSMVKEMIDNGEKRDISLFYFVNKSSDIAFKELFDQASSIGVITKYITTSSKERGYLHSYFSKRLVDKYIPSYKDRLFYISGSQGFVASARQTLLKKGIPPQKIITDFFPGYN